MSANKDKINLRTSLVSVAMLKVNYDLHNRDYIDYLVPFVGHALASHKGKLVVLDLVKKDIQEIFGLNLPRGTIELCLKRMTKHKYLIRDSNQYIVSKDIPESDIDERRVAAKRDADVVVSALKRFMQASAQKELSDEEAYGAIIEYLKQFSIECLSAYVRGTPLPDVQNGKAESDVVMVSLFVKQAYLSESELFERIVNLVKGHMLSNALLCPDLEAIGRKFDDVKFFFDTPYLFRLLGLDGTAHKKLALELTGLLKNLRGKLYVFSHTLDEMSSILLYCEKSINDARANGQILREFRRSGKTASDVVLLKGKIPELLKTYGVEITSTPDYKYTKLQIDESAFEHLYRDEVPGIRENAIKHDVNSVRSIYVLRMDVHPRRLEDSIAVFVTTNAAFSKAAFDYGRKYEASREVTTVITDFSLSNLAWLKAPVGAPDLPQREVIAYCYAALQPSSKLWARYLEELEKLKAESAITERDHQLLRFSLKAEEELMGMTLGADEELSGLSILQIRDKIVAEIAAEKDMALTQERARSESISELLKTVESEKGRLEQRYYWIANKAGFIIGKVIWYAGFICIVVGSLIASFMAEYIYQWTWYLRGPAVGLLTLIVMFSIVSSIYGTTLKELRGRIEKKVTDVVYNRLRGSAA